MASITDIQFIMGTVLGHDDDSPLFKAFEMYGFTDVIGIATIEDRDIRLLKYQHHVRILKLRKSEGVCPSTVFP
jgi:hypothetical protein